MNYSYFTDEDMRFRELRALLSVPETGLPDPMPENIRLSGSSAMPGSFICEALLPFGHSEWTAPLPVFHVLLDLILHTS